MLPARLAGGARPRRGAHAAARAPRRRPGPPARQRRRDGGDRPARVRRRGAAGVRRVRRRDAGRHPVRDGRRVLPALRGVSTSSTASSVLGRVPTSVICGTADKLTSIGHSRKLHVPDRGVPAAGVRGRGAHGDPGAPRPGQRRARPADHGGGRRPMSAEWRSGGSGRKRPRRCWPWSTRAFAARPPLDPPADALAETEASMAACLDGHRRPARRARRRPGRARVLLDPEAHGSGVYLRRFGVVPAAQGRGVASGAGPGRAAMRPRLPGVDRAIVAGSRGAARHGRLLAAAGLRRDRLGTGPTVKLARRAARRGRGADRRRDARPRRPARQPCCGPATSSSSPASWGPARPPSPRASARGSGCAAGSPRRPS